MKRFVNLDTRHWMTLVLACALAGSAGCGGSAGQPPVDPKKQATISGSVTVDGKPIPVDSVIYFESAETGTSATGKIDALGNFAAKPPDPNIGLEAGRYRVIIRPPGKPAVQTTDPNYNQFMKGGGATKPAPLAAEDTSVIPKPFQSRETTKLILEVQPGPNKFDIDLAKIK
jgi:hypothetical protein